MNWVGGSRSRLVTKDDAKKQREFFEKRKMQKKLKNLGLALPASPGGAGAAATGSVDLVTLFIVNQIATKKENKDLPKVAVLGSGRRGSNRQNNPLVLPMSPCSPSQLSLVESQPQYSVHGMTKSRHVIPQGFRCQQLSPVLESPFSDNSASDYPPPTFARLSPFSSMSSASSCQGVFPLKLSRRQLPPRCSPPPWVTSGMRHVQFQPFSQPRGMTDNLPWSCGSDPALYQQETPTAAQVLFGSPEPDVSDVRVRDVSFSLDQTEDKESALDFTLHQSDAEQHFEEDVFRGFSNEDDEKEAFHFGSARSKIYLRDGTPVKSSAPQTVPDLHCVGMELSNCSDKNFSYPGHNSGHVENCGYSQSYSCAGCYLSSDSNDEEEYCPPCLQASASSHAEQACCAHASNQGSKGEPEHGPLTPHIKPQMNVKVDETVTNNAADKASGSGGRRLRSGTAQSASIRPPVQTLTSEIFECRTLSGETRDAGTQTVAWERCDASTQCGFLIGSAAPGFSIGLPPVGVSVQCLATGRQTDTAAASAEPSTHTAAATGNGGGKHTPWSRKKPEAGSPPGGCGFVTKFSANNDDSKVSPETHGGRFPEALSSTAGRGIGEEGRGERGRRESDTGTGEL
ncbi:uncharacterized protein LOC118285967 isoform X2 [Scophthalmus maximus]|uniref:uncharacterized protein LOC118285967 isoform X2 n=1 Tax=Scophthalmus maximus TaxID=52904 RepID=UPI0015E15B0E|nr:uncharacterized protein LOC118285967 isoform X2 [Scophthalmus maximus]